MIANISHRLLRVIFPYVVPKLPRGVVMKLDDEPALLTEADADSLAIRAHRYTTDPKTGLPDRRSWKHARVSVPGRALHAASKRSDGAVIDLLRDAMTDLVRRLWDRTPPSWRFLGRAKSVARHVGPRRWFT